MPKLNTVAAACLATSLLAAGCSIGAPPGFSSGDQWTFPLVGPLENGQLVTAAFINGKGPYLMAIDPDAPASIIDAAIASELELRAGIGPRVLDETDTHRRTQVAQVPRIKLGNLTVENLLVTMTKVGAFTVDGRQIRGVIGRDIIADSLAFGFDRQLGLAYLTTQKGFVTPTTGDKWSFSILTNRLDTAVLPPGRKIVDARIGGKKLSLHVDLGAVRSQLRSDLWKDAGLTPVPLQSNLVDEVATRRQFTTATVANEVVVGATHKTGVIFAPYDDKRWEAEDIDGTLGLAFFDGHAVWANWDRNKIYVTPASEATPEVRISRWGSTLLAACEHTGCASVRLADPNNPTTSRPRPSAADRALLGDEIAPSEIQAVAPRMMPRNVVLIVDRDPAAKDKDLEVIVQATPPVGSDAKLPHIAVSLPAGSNSATRILDERFTGATVSVVDVSPFPRVCNQPGSCAYIVGE